MSHFFFYIIEPISYTLYFIGFLFLFLKIERKLRYLILIAYSLVCTALMIRATIRLDSDTSNTYLYNILYLITSLAFGFYFFEILKNQWKRLVALIAGLSVLIYYFINIKEVYFDSIGFVITSTGIIVLIFLFLDQIMTNVTEEPLFNNFDFWFICVQLMYHLGSFAIFLSYNYYTHRFFSEGSPDSFSRMMGYLWVVHNILLFVGSVITCAGVFWIYYRKKKISQHV